MDFIMKIIEAIKKLVAKIQYMIKVFRGDAEYDPSMLA